MKEIGCRIRLQGMRHKPIKKRLNHTAKVWNSRYCFISERNPRRRGDIIEM